MVPPPSQSGRNRKQVCRYTDDGPQKNKKRNSKTRNGRSRIGLLPLMHAEKIVIILFFKNHMHTFRIRDTIREISGLWSKCLFVDTERHNLSVVIKAREEELLSISSLQDLQRYPEIHALWETTVYLLKVLRSHEGRIH